MPSLTMEPTKSPRERELRGRGTRRYQLPMHGDSNEGSNSSGLCACGCGGITSIATQNDSKSGILKGQHRRYLKSHQHRGVPRSQDVKDRLRIANKGRFTGEENLRWRGGVQIRRGRRYILVGTDHPMASASGYVAEYRLVAAGALGRFLSSAECVHHVDLDETNNTPENLVVVSRSQHMKIHQLIRRGVSPAEAVRTVLEQG